MKLILVICLTLVRTLSFAQSSEGIVTYKVIESSTDEYEQQLIEMRKAFNLSYTKVLTFREDSVRFDMYLGQTVASYGVLDFAKKKGIILAHDLRGEQEEKYVAILDEKNFSDLLGDTILDYEVKAEKEKKTILGYVCNKYTVINKQGGIERTYWTTDQIHCSNFYEPRFHGLAGFPLEYEFVQNSVKYTIVATEFKNSLKGKDTNSLFSTVAPENYQVVPVYQLINALLW